MSPLKTKRQGPRVTFTMRSWPGGRACFTDVEDMTATDSRYQVAGSRQREGNGPKFIEGCNVYVKKRFGDILRKYDSIAMVEAIPSISARRELKKPLLQA